MMVGRHPAARRRSYLRVLLFTLAASINQANAAQPSTDEMLEALLARGTALFSARITFDVSSKVEGDKREETRQRAEASESETVETPQPHVLSLSGENWILRYAGAPDFVMNFNDATTRFYQTHSEKTGTYRSMQMSAPATLEEMFGKDYTYAIARMGTLWYQSQLKFVEQQRHRVKREAGDRIDGHPTVLLRWRVDTSDLDDAIVVVPPSLHEKLAGYLELYAAPSLGYAIPRIDYRTLDGRLARRYESSDFVEVDDGLFFPKLGRCIALADDERHITTFTVSSIEYVNQDLPKDEFAVKVPPDTRVRDSRPGRPQIVFHLGDEEEVDEIARAVGTANSAADAFPFRIGCLAANGLLVLFLLIIWVRRQCCSR